MLPVLLVCMLLACAGLVFAIYSHRELSLLKTQIREHEKLIQTLQVGNSVQHIKVGDYVLLMRLCGSVKRFRYGYGHAFQNCLNISFVYISGIRSSSYSQKHSRFLHLRWLVVQTFCVERALN